MRVAGSPIFLGSPGATSSTPEDAAVRSQSVSLTPADFATRDYRGVAPRLSQPAASTLPGVDQRHWRVRMGGTRPFAKRLRTVAGLTAVVLTRSADRDGAGTSTPATSAQPVTFFLQRAGEPRVEAGPASRGQRRALPGRRLGDLGSGGWNERPGAVRRGCGCRW
jgi:hypothetical protein